MSTDKNYQLVIIGYGGMGSYHGQLIEEVERIQLSGVYDIVNYRMDLARSRGYHTYESMEAVLSDASVDIVLIATPNEVHKELSIKALRAGKHVICEKPVTITSSDLTEIMQVAREENRIFMVHQNRRWDEDYLIVKGLINKKVIGEVFHLESRVHGANGIPGDWRQLKANGGGMLLDWGVHLLDQLLQLTDSKTSHVAASLSTVLGNEVDDGFSTHIRFRNGLTALIEVGTTNYIKLPRWYVKGTEGTAIIRDWDLSGEIVKTNSNSVKMEPLPIQAGNGLTKTMAPPSEESTLRLPLEKPEIKPQGFYLNFIDVIEGAAEPFIRNEEVFRVMQLIEAIFEAAETQSVVQLDL
ncbi:Gfo/Idh/MocA family protein [Paenibacillus tuaregi]|uniref:Gfo/Idh/MocA family protein n=1 Tax=Paenibacillus tuaregi TaxID=1816681 RepID=UPI0008391701|nr:Gfo/Idh/MocA family oxidoreductase [Paenibacillus tuaregi]